MNDDPSGDEHRDEHADAPPGPAGNDTPTVPGGGQGALEARLREAEDRLMRTQAELENFRKRSQREFDEARRYREIDLLRDLLPVLDNVERAIEAAGRSTDVEGLLSGFRLTGKQIEKVLLIHGCQPIETEGRPFDPTVHEAILQQPATGTAPGTVIGVATKGYRLHDRVVRPAQVIVSTES